MDFSSMTNLEVACLEQEIKDELKKRRVSLPKGVGEDDLTRLFDRSVEVHGRLHKSIERINDELATVHKDVTNLSVELRRVTDSDFAKYYAENFGDK